MENKINIAELLKDCPKGMELDCTIWDNIVFEEIDWNNIVIYRKSVGSKVYLTQYGELNSVDGKCVIFPKGKTTWEGFHRPFDDGDILATTDGKFIAIIKKNGGKCYVCYHTNGTYFEIDSCGWFDRFATEEEKAELFRAIKDNGYKWNDETKTLEKFIEPKFKVGDTIKHKEETKWGCTIKRVEDRYYVEGHPTSFTLSFDEQNEYELIPNKFDISKLKPFDSRVLVRDYINRIWIPTFWGTRLEDDSNCSYLTTNGCYKYCIPHEGNEHLLGTTNDCANYYKTWEK